MAGRAERTVRHPFEAVERPWRALARKDVRDARAVVSSRTSRGHDGRRAEVARRARSTTFWCCGAGGAEVAVVASLRRTKIRRDRDMTGCSLLAVVADGAGERHRGVDDFL